MWICAVDWNPNANYLFRRTADYWSVFDADHRSIFYILIGWALQWVYLHLIYCSSFEICIRLNCQRRRFSSWKWDLRRWLCFLYVLFSNLVLGAHKRTRIRYIGIKSISFVPHIHTLCSRLNNGLAEQFQHPLMRAMCSQASQWWYSVPQHPLWCVW